MKLDRNLNPDGRGKYALINLRKLKAAETESSKHACAMLALSILHEHGIIQWGNESPGEQFFVMKYKDQFTASALSAYSEAIRNYIVENRMTPSKEESLREYWMEINDQAEIARKEGNRIPD